MNRRSSGRIPGRGKVVFWFLGALLWLSGVAHGQEFRTLGEATREEKAGWVVLRLMGTPREIGYRYGYLLAPEIDDANRALRLSLRQDTGKEWSFYRETAQKLFWAKLEPEYQQELEGLAEGLKARGLAYDTTDMLAHNSWIEISGYYLPAMAARQTGRRVSRAPMACSAFIATGKATADGKIVMGHNFWWDYLLGQRWKVILDVRPEKGHRFVMDAFPGFLHSGSDFVVNAAGIVICETTIGGFIGFDVNGKPEFMRARKAAQYARSLDDFYRIMLDGNNGGYANAWLVGDTKTNEIGKLELGLKNVIFHRSRDGYYVGANFPEDPKLLAEECAPGSDRNPSCLGRRARWLRLMKENHGRIDASRAKAFLADTYDERARRAGASDCTLCGRGDLGVPPSPFGATNAKVLTTDLAQRMRFWGRMGFPDGSDFSAKAFLAKAPNYAWMEPFLHNISPHPWTVLGALP